MRKGSLKFRLAAIVIIGLRQLNIAPKIIILPSRGPIGNFAKWKPSGVRFSFLSKAFKSVKS